MVFLKKICPEDAEKEWLFVRDMPEDENGMTNAYAGISWEDFRDKALPAMIAFEEGKGLPEGYVPDTTYFLWDGDTIVGLFRIRHYLCESLRTGAGHIGYFIAKPFRGKGYGREGLRLALEEAHRIVPEEEIYLRVLRTNPASLHVMLRNGGRIVSEDAEHFCVRVANPGKGRYPSAAEAKALLAEAEQCNPGPWGNHSRTAAHCAERIAFYAGLCPEKAYVLGLLHDIGRKFGKRHLGHVSDGYSYMMRLGYPDAARICLTHSFNEMKIEGYVGNFDTTEEETALIRTKLREVSTDDYDSLIQLCDAISGSEGVMDIIERMSDVKRRYGDYEQSKWDRNLELKALFEERMGRGLYDAVEKDSFSPRAGERKEAGGNHVG